MEQSTIYIKCPQCGANGLLTHTQGTYRCANCMYDYTQLKDDPGKLDAVLIDTMKQKGFGPVFAIALYQRVMLKPSPESGAYIQQLAEKNGIDIYQGHRTFVKVLDWLFKVFKK